MEDKNPHIKILDSLQVDEAGQEMYKQMSINTNSDEISIAISDRRKGSNNAPIHKHFKIRDYKKAMVYFEGIGLHAFTGRGGRA